MPPQTQDIGHSVPIQLRTESSETHHRDAVRYHREQLMALASAAAAWRAPLEPLSKTG